MFHAVTAEKRSVRKAEHKSYFFIAIGVRKSNVSIVLNIIENACFFESKTRGKIGEEALQKIKFNCIEISPAIVSLQFS